MRDCEWEFVDCGGKGLRQRGGLRGFQIDGKKNVLKFDRVKTGG